MYDVQSGLALLCVIFSRGQYKCSLLEQACGREAECIQVYKTVEQTHPNKAIKKQAAELRYIMEAPKLTLRPEERISLPLLDNLDRYK